MFNRLAHSLTPARLISAKAAQAITGKPRADLIYQDNKTPHQPPIEGIKAIVEASIAKMESRPYQKRGNNDLVSRFMHPDFQKLADEGIGICGQIGDIEHCDGCRIDRGENPDFPLRIEAPMSEILPVERRSPKETIKQKQSISLVSRQPVG